MKAAVVSSFGVAPTYREHEVPVPQGPNEVLVQVVAAGLHPRVRSQADGSHYTSSGDLPLVPGIDGVGRDPEGRLRYFVLPDTSMGAMAEQTVIDLRRSIVLPDAADPVAVAAAMNPVMSSWVALRRRTRLESGQHVVVLGATGNAGQLAVRIARLLGAARVTAVGRDRAALARLSELEATDTVCLDDRADLAERLGNAAANADVVIDYVWGQPTADALRAIVPARADDNQTLTWIQVGSVAGPESPIPSAALRATRLQIVGSGQGSVSTREIVAELPALAQAITDGQLPVQTRAVPLADVEQSWDARTADGARLVVTPS